EITENNLTGTCAEKESGVQIEWNRETGELQEKKIALPEGFIVSFDTRGDIRYSEDTKRFETSYTGKNIKPLVITASEGTQLVEGVDYTVKYSGNKNVSTKKKHAKVTVTGKGNYKDKKTLDFYIVPVNIRKAEANGTLTIDPIYVEKGKKIAPVIRYNGYTLTSKEYKLSYTGKAKASTTKVSITGKNGFTGTIEDVPVTVISSDEVKAAKLKVTIKPDKHTFQMVPDPENPGKFMPEEQTLTVTYTETDEDGKPKTISGELTVKDASGKLLKAGDPDDPEADFTISYLNNDKAGTATVIITGLGDTYRSAKPVKKTFKIGADKKTKLKAELEDSEEVLTYNGSAVKPKIRVSGVDDPENIGSPSADGELLLPMSNLVLTEGKDYKVTYYNNRTPDRKKTPGYKITFLGNYKGHDPITGGTFAIQKASFEASDLEIHVFDMVYNGKGKYQPAPFVIYKGKKILTKNDYSVDYYEGATKVTGKKMSLREGENNRTLSVRIKGKGIYASNECEKTYDVIRKTDNLIDLSKARIVEEGTNKAVGNRTYTGSEIKPEIDVQIKVNGKYVIVDPERYELSYYNNTSNGKATIRVESKEGTDTAGSKTATFKIGSRSFKTLEKILRQLFG
ncbi:MAG: hypothetical protein K6F53_11800, partial [Lachnospiraceae bacterium]|nr:hypothetical protein [Lachnospiraceae bacterium]